MTTSSLATKTTLSTTAINTKPITAVVAGQTSLNATKPVQNQGTADTNPGSNNPPQGFDGPSPNLSGVSKTSADSFAPQGAADKQTSVEQALGLVSQSAALQSLAGQSSGTAASQSQREKLTDLQGSIGSNQPPGFDQGFDGKPASLGSNTMTSETAGGVSSIAGSASSSNSAMGTVAGGGTAFNPMDAFSGGSVGGPLGAAASAHSQNLADMDKGGLISLRGDAAEKAGKTAGGVTTGAALVETVTAGTTQATLKGIVEVGRLGFSSSFLTPGLTVAGSVAAVAGAFTAGIAVGTVANEGGTLLLSTVTGKENYTLGDLLYDIVNPDEDPAPTNAPAGGGAKMPDPENSGVNVNIVTQSLLDQLNAAKAGKPGSQGGSGDSTPVTEGGSDPVVRNGSIVVNQASLQGQNLFGQPGGSALGENVSGGDKGLNGFSGSNGAGVINPGNEAGTPAGDARYQQDPGQALGDGKPAAATPSLNNSSSQDTISSSVSSTLAAGIRNLTLTGTAAINGSGNSLDNLIIGNMAANELRGEGGNDTLDGKGGNDLLEGSAGQDLLTGGTGADRFRFATGTAFGAGRADRITDFSRSEGDRIEISRSAFGLGTGATVSFQAVSSDLDLSRALATGTLLVQDLRDGSLLFNQNGSAAGAGLGGLFATVNPGFTLQASDFTLIG